MPQIALSQFLEWIDVAGNDDAKDGNESTLQDLTRRKANANFAKNYFDVCAEGALTEEMYQQICLRFIERHDDIIQKRFDLAKLPEKEVDPLGYSAVLYRAGLALSDISIDIRLCDEVYYPERTQKYMPEELKPASFYQALNHRSLYIGLNDIRKSGLIPDISIFVKPTVIIPN